MKEPNMFSSFEFICTHVTMACVLFLLYETLAGNNRTVAVGSVATAAALLAMHFHQLSKDEK